MDSSGLITERLFIRPLMEQDTSDILEIRGDQDTADMAGVPCMKDLDDAVDYVNTYIDTESAFSIVLGDEVIGLIEIYADDELVPGVDFMGYYIKKNYRRKGYMTETLMALRNEWTEEGADIPMLWIFLDNDASRRVAEKCGWTSLGYHLAEIGPLKQYVEYFV